MRRTVNIIEKAEERINNYIKKHNCSFNKAVNELILREQEAVKQVQKLLQKNQELEYNARTLEKIDERTEIIHELLKQLKVYSELIRN